MPATSILGGITKETTSDAVRSLLLRILNVLTSPMGYDKTLARQRGTVLVESGTVTTVTTVTTVATLTNMAQIDGMQGRIMVVGVNLTAWNQCVRSRIS